MVRSLLAVLCLLAGAGHAAEFSVGGFALGMDLVAVERVLEGYAKKGIEIRRIQFGAASTGSPQNGGAGVSTIKIGKDCSGPSGAHKCEQITIYFARPDLGGNVRGVESILFLPDGTGMQAAIDELQRAYGKARVSRSYERKMNDTTYPAIGMLWGGETDRVESADGWFPINAMGEDQRIGGKYAYAELWQFPGGDAYRVRVAAGDDELNIRQARAFAADHERRDAAERERWRACVDKYVQEQRLQPVPVAANAPAKDEVLSYGGVGRIRFTIPVDLPYIAGVPHFTAGPRLLGADGCRERFTVHIYSYREPQTLPKYRQEMEQKLRGRVPIETLSGNQTLLYSTQTAGKPDAEWRFATYGVVANGRAVIQFEHLSNDQSHARRDRLMRVVASAEFLDTDKWASWDQLAKDEDTWDAVISANKSKDYRKSYVLAKQLCDQWTVSRSDIGSRTIAGHACLHAAMLILTDEYLDASPNHYGPTKDHLERALLAYGDAAELKEQRQSVYANLAVVHGLGLGVQENLDLARSYYAKEGTRDKMVLAKIEGKVGPKTAALLKKLGY